MKNQNKNLTVNELIKSDATFSAVYITAKNNRKAFYSFVGACLFAISADENPSEALNKISLILKKTAEDNGEKWESVKGAENRKLRYLKKLYEIRSEKIDTMESPEAIADFVKNEGWTIEKVNEEYKLSFGDQILAGEKKSTEKIQKESQDSIAKLIKQIQKVESDPVLFKTFKTLLLKDAGLKIEKSKAAKLEIAKKAA